MMLFTLILHIWAITRYKYIRLSNDSGVITSKITCISQQGMSRRFHSDTPSHAQTRRLLDEPEVIARKRGQRGANKESAVQKSRSASCYIMICNVSERIQERHDSKTTQSFRDKPRIEGFTSEIVLI
jgi:hypothetical protein